MRAVHKRYQREFIPAMAAYVLLLLGSVALLRHVEQVGLRVLLAVLPLLPIALVIRALVRVIRDQDELERRIELESIAISAALTGFGFFSYGLLAGAKVLPAIAGATVAIWVLPVLFGSYGAVKCLVVARHYHRE